jgi:HlyD family secretion protein
MRKKIIFLVIFVVVLAIFFYKIIPYFKAQDTSLTVSGRVEADEIELASRISGKIERVLVEDGMKVKKGDTIAQIEDADLQSKRRQTMSRIEEVKEKIMAAALDLEYTDKNVEHSIDESKKALSVAEARLKQAEAKKENAEKELKRYSSLLDKEVISQEHYDNVKLAHRLAQEEAVVALKEVERANVSLMKAEDARKLIRAKDKELLALKKSLSQLDETLEQVDIHIGYTVVTSPSDGIILRKVAEPGEVLLQGSVIGVMIIPEDTYVRTYVPEKYIGRMHIGMDAEVVSDAYPARPITGSICYISDRAEFTPKEVQSYEERVKQVFAVKICFSNKTGSTGEQKAYYDVLKKGMPVDVRFPISTEK